MRVWPLIAALIAVAHPAAAQSPAWDRLAADLRDLSERCDGMPVVTLHRRYLTARAAETVEYFAVDAVFSEAQDGAPQMVVWRQSELCQEAHDRPTCALIGRFEDEGIHFEPAPAPIPLPSLSPAALDQP